MKFGEKLAIAILSLLAIGIAIGIHYLKTH